jgi:3-methyl-2-oxobutanoate hydroxymethyltransferase
MRINARDIVNMKKKGRKIAVLTSYTYPMARILDGCGIPVVLVGDSLGMVEAGYETTLPVTMDEMVYHTKVVSRGCKNAFIVSDMPFMSYQKGAPEALQNAGRLIKEGGAQGVKVEGRCTDVIKAVTGAGIPVMGHAGLLPQSVWKTGFRTQGGGKGAKILADALAIEKAGAFAVVLECIPTMLSRRITKALKIPTIGIGAGPYCDGQVLVLNDMLGLGGCAPGFVKKYANLSAVIEKAVREYKKDVEEGKFP